jgi:CopG family transcriptional regulator / antitoxin EndoAI
MKGATINLSLPKGLLKKADLEAQREERSRSELMRIALQSYLERKTVWEKIFNYGTRLSKKKKLKPSDIDTAVAEVRKSV